MSEYTIDINGKRFELSTEFRDALEERARREYAPNPDFSCWWKNEDGDPTLVIETTGTMVPWDRMDQLEMGMDEEPTRGLGDPEPEEDVDSGNGMAELKPNEKKNDNTRPADFGRTHFAVTPFDYDEVPHPGGEDPDKIPPKRDEIDDNAVVLWVPQHPDIEVTWGAGEAMVPMFNWVEWNVQEKADQPRPVKDKRNSHDAFESLCNIHDCEVVGEYTPSNDIPEGDSGQVERKGEDWYSGNVVGDRWNV